jgi:hypothetical protein
MIVQRCFNGDQVEVENNLADLDVIEQYEHMVNRIAPCNTKGWW